MHPVARKPQSALTCTVSVSEDPPTISPMHLSIDGPELMGILSLASLNNSITTQTEWAVSSPVFVMVAVVSRQVRPQLTGVPASRENATGLWVGVGAGVGARVVTASAGAGTVLVAGPGPGVAVDRGVPEPPGPPPGRDAIPPPSAASPCSRIQAQMTTRTATAMHAATRRALRDIAIALLLGCMQG